MAWASKCNEYMLYKHTASDGMMGKMAPVSLEKQPILVSGIWKNTAFSPSFTQVRIRCCER